jgi:2,5-dihydroxypyridine 5,6-dioxygenase
MGSKTKLLADALRLSNVKEGETVLIASDSTIKKSTFHGMGGPTEDYKEACAFLGVNCYEIELPSPLDWTMRLEKFPKVSDAVSNADFLIQHTVGLLYSDAHNAALANGKRSLLCMGPEAQIRKLWPRDVIKKRTWASAELYEKAKEIRIKSDAGTDLTMDKTNRIASAQYGRADEPGRWDNLLAGLTASAPIEDSANGVLVIDVGDNFLHLGRYVSDPVKCTIKDGKIVKIEGGLEAKMFRWWLANWKDERAYNVSHIGWGTNENGNWLDGFMNIEVTIGTTLIAFGSNFFVGPAKHVGLGGKNKPLAHIDIGLRNHEFYLDGELVVNKNEKIVHPSLKGI